MVFLYIRHIETLCEPKNTLLVELGNILPNTEKRRLLLFAILVTIAADNDLHILCPVRLSLLSLP